MKLSGWLSLVGGPMAFILLLFLGGSETLTPEIWYVLALAAWMVIWWITEAVPIPVTSLLPMVVLPILNIFKISEATAPYASPIIFLFMGGFMIALALEKHKLHLRIALSLIKITGTSGNGIILGFMLATAALSMWISNTATAVMMLPVATSVVSLLQSNQPQADFKNFALTLMLSIAYSANIGGTITLIGTPPNIVMSGHLAKILDYEIFFSQWLAIGMPVGLLLLAACYLLLTRILFPNSVSSIKGSDRLIQDQLRALGPISREERWVLLIFVTTALSWIFRKQINGLLGTDILSDTVIAIAGGLIMFVLPVAQDKKALLLWEDTQRLPWGILLLFGGGMCLASALEKTGIIQLIGQSVGALGSLNPWLIVLFVTALVLFMTELMSNVALVTIFIPVAIGVAGGLEINPLLLVIPSTLASSCAFMMPISTPPNAIVFASGHIKMRDMMKAGVWLNLVAILILVLATMVIIPRAFPL